MAHAKLSDDVIQRIVVEYAELRNYSAVARKLGVSDNAVKKYVTRAKGDAPKETKTDAETRGKVSELERTVEFQQRRIKGLMDARRLRIDVPKTPRARGETMCRVVAGDFHGAHVDEGALSAFLGDLAGLQPHHIILGGDIIDCGGFLAQHHTWGFVAETGYSFEDDILAGNAILDEIQRTCPDAEIEFLMGNHEHRIERWAVTQALRSQIDARFLLENFSPRKLLNLEERGIKSYDYGRVYDDLPVPGTIKRGHCHFIHGNSTARNAERVLLDQFGGNVVFFHTHRAASATKRTISEGVIGAWNPGCLCKLQPLWQNTKITDWSHGYGIQFVQADGSFMHVNVPIIKDRSYLADFTGRMAS